MQHDGKESWHDCPVERITVDCPACGRSYKTAYRASFELDPEFADDYIEEMTARTCPAYGHSVALAGLVVRTDGVWQLRRAD